MDQGFVVCGNSNQVVEIVTGLYSKTRSMRGSNRSRGITRGSSGRGRGNWTRGGNISRGRVLKYKWRGGRNQFHGCRNDMPCPEVNDLVVIGDSIALRMVKHVQNDVTGRFVLCRGGMTTKAMNDALRKNYVDFGQKDVLLMIGTNDLLHGVKFDAILRNVDAIVQELQRKKAGQIYICTVMFSPKLESDCHEEVVQLNEGLMERNSFENNINVIECSCIFMVDGEISYSYFEKSHGEGSYDDIHPNADALGALHDFIASNVI